MDNTPLLHQEGQIKVVKVIGPEGFERCLDVKIMDDFASLATWELDAFHHAIYSTGTELYRWLDLSGSRGHSGVMKVQRALPASSSFVCGVASRVLPFESPVISGPLQ